MSQALSPPEDFAPVGALPGHAALARGLSALTQRLTLAAESLRRPIRAGQRGAAELYAVGFDRLWFALAVALAMYLAGWLLGNLALAPVPPMPVPPPAPVTGTLAL